MREREYILNVAPISWERPGLNKARRFFDKQAQDKLHIGCGLRNQHGDDTPKFMGPLHVDITFYLPEPIKGPRYTKKLPWSAARPDIDNLQKFIFDTITDTKMIWGDDSHVASLVAKKFYDKNPRTHIIIRELE